MSTPLDVRTETTTETPLKRLEVRDLANIMTRTLPEDGMDRMTSQHVEEILAVPALTAHL